MFYGAKECGRWHVEVGVDGRRSYSQLQIWSWQENESEKAATHRKNGYSERKATPFLNFDITDLNICSLWFIL